MASNLLKSFLTLLNSLGQTFATVVPCEVVIRESDANATVSLIFSVTQLVRYSFACHVSCKDRQDRLLGVRLLAMLDNCSIY